MGAGKSAVGQALATALDVPFRDSDDEIVAASAMTIAEIFARDGEAFFRDKESKIIERLLDDTPAILSTGGGAFLSANNRTVIATKGVAVWLKADLDVLWARVRHKKTRPLLMTEDPKATLTELYHTRVPQYALADLVVETEAGYSIAETKDRVVQALLSRPDVLEMPRD